jgi:hypothetical protein
MPVIDVQAHTFDRNHSGRPWASPSHGLDSATGEEMVAAMNSAGVDGAIMVSMSTSEAKPHGWSTMPNDSGPVCRSGRRSPRAQRTSWLTGA